jgi:hypothetical protein
VTQGPHQPKMKALIFEHMRQAPKARSKPRGVRGHAPPGNFFKYYVVKVVKLANLSMPEGIYKVIMFLTKTK